MLSKICNKCGKSYAANQQCKCRGNRHKLYDKYSRNKDSQKIYHSKQWELLTKMCKARCSGLDFYVLMTTGRPVVPASGLCHHIIEVTENRSLAFDIDNLFYVGADSHAEIHKIYNSGEQNKRSLQRKMQTFLQKFLQGAG